MADPTTTVISCPSACTVTLEHTVSLYPFNLSVEAAGALAVAVIALWATAWVMRMLADFIGDRGNAPSGSDGE